MNTLKNDKEHSAVVILFREKTAKSDRLLIGESLNKFCKGKEIAPGGHIEEGERMFDTAVHEGPDECGLTPDRESMSHVGHMDVSYLNGTIVKIDFIMVTRWTGTLKAAPNKDFTTLRFLEIKDLPWHRMPKCDPAVMMGILQGNFVTAEAWFGENIDDFLNCQVDVRPMN